MGKHTQLRLLAAGLFVFAALLASVSTDKADTTDRGTKPSVIASIVAPSSAQKENEATDASEEPNINQGFILLGIVVVAVVVVSVVLPK